MGSLFSKLRFFQSKATTREQLEQIDADIQSIEDYKWTKMRQQKNLMALIFYGGGFLYAIIAILFYFCFLPMTHNFYDKCLYSLPIFVLPAIAFMLQRSLQWYFRWVLEGNEDRLKELRKEKRKILDKVKETETYKVARELLEQFDPSSLKVDDKGDSPPKTPLTSPGNQSVRFRGGGANTPLQSPLQRPFTPNNRPITSLNPSMPFAGGMNPSQRPMPGMNPALHPAAAAAANTQRRLIRPIISSDRGVVEKMVDYVVGDGPNNRYALICCWCRRHNGMALKDEFEYLAFMCCFCNAFNPARKFRTSAPRIAPASSTSSETKAGGPENDVDKANTEDESVEERRGSGEGEGDITLPSVGDGQATISGGNTNNETELSTQEEEEPVSEAAADSVKEVDIEVTKKKEEENSLVREED